DKSKPRSQHVKADEQNAPNQKFRFQRTEHIDCLDKEKTDPTCFLRPVLSGAEYNAGTLQGQIGVMDIIGGEAISGQKWPAVPKCQQQYQYGKRWPARYDAFDVKVIKKELL
ncbi:MAG: hypothetical protein RID59_16695, partial [Hoeflea sp.]